MLDAPLYVEVTDKSSDGQFEMLMSATFDGRKSAKIVTPNMGSAFFDTFHGGNVEITAVLQQCRTPSGTCSGELEVTVNARSDAPRR
jgi:hypothetical protein